MRKKRVAYTMIYHNITKFGLLFLFLFGIIFLIYFGTLFLAEPVEAAGNEEYQVFPQFEVSFSEEVRQEPVTARVLLFFSQSDDQEPRYSPTLRNLQPVYAIDVNNLKPGQKVVFSPEKFQAPDALAFPCSFNQLEDGIWYVQALFDIDETWPEYNVSGNLFSRVAQWDPKIRGREAIELIANQTPPIRQQLADTERVKLVEITSKLLSDFHSKEIKLRAGVVLPAEYNEKPNKQFPVLYIIPGFGGDYTAAASYLANEEGIEMIQVVLDPKIPMGHSKFANSANNGPVSDALIQELIPEIENRFRAIPHPYGRLLTGHSSGGWASLWLQVTYPDFFGGCWSLAPDPVDFSHFQTMNIYKDRNGHWTEEGYPRPLARDEEKVVATFGQVNRREYVVGYGGNLDAFNAAFSPRGEDGRPMPLMNKLTGVIDPEVAEYWKRYDIRQKLEKDWSSLGPKLKGNLHIIAGAWDNYYLETAVESLKDFLATTDYDGYVEIVPGNHSSFRTEQFQDRLDRERTEHFAAIEKEYQETHRIPVMK